MTPQRAKELLPIITAFANGEQVEYRSGHGRWELPDVASVMFCDNLEYRIKSKPVTRPWNKPEDVPVNCWLRKVDTERFMVLIIAIRPDGVRCSLADGATQVIEWDEIHNREWSTDLKAWHPCTVTEESK